jgi:hypothetical protein
MKTGERYRIAVDPGALRPDSPALPALVARVADLVFRTDLDQPGFALLDLGTDCTPADFRAALVALTAALDAVYRTRFGRRLVFLSLGRFDQQATTRAHRDGAPDESLLVLGYEPTEVESRVSLLDYTACAREHDLRPREFLDRFNPAWQTGEEMLVSYETELTPFRPEHYQVLLINNSAAPYETRQRGMLGVLHKAIVPAPRPDRPRWVNSLTLTTADLDGPPGELLAEVQGFIEAGATVAR